MPHLQFELGRSVTADQRDALAAWATERFAAEMGTGTGHVAVTVRAYADGGLTLGRAPAGEPVAVLNADIRAGRSADQREAFARAVIDRFDSRFDVPREHCYVVFTEHPGEDFHLAEGPLESWTRAEEESGALGE